MQRRKVLTLTLLALGGLPGIAAGRNVGNGKPYKTGSRRNFGQILPEQHPLRLMPSGGNNYLCEWFHSRTPQGRVSVEFSTDGFSKGGVALKMRQLPHKHGKKFYLRMIHDPFRKGLFRPLVQAVTQYAEKHGADPIDLLLSLAQSCQYQHQNTYQCWPSESLVNEAGDCSDTAVLFACLVDTYDEMYGDRLDQPLWCFLHSPNHLSVGVREKKGGPAYSGVGWKYSGFTYFHCETTARTEIGAATDFKTARVWPPTPRARFAKR